MTVRHLARLRLVVLIVALAVPAPLRAEDVTTVPISIVNGHAFVTAQINGRGPFVFAFDTGAGDLIASDAARRIGLRTSGTFPIYGTGEGAERGSSARVTTLAIGGAVIHDTTVTVASLDRIRAAEGFAFDGLIGHELLDRYVATIDYANRTLTLSLPSAFQAPPEATTVPLRSFGGIPIVAGSVDGIAGDFALDTGDRGSLTLMDRFTARYDLRARYRPAFAGTVGYGFGGPVRAAVARVGTFSFAGFSVAGIAARFPTLHAGYFARSRRLAGNVGSGILSRFVITFDVPEKKLVFSRSAGFDLPDRFDRSGMWLTREAAGLRVGDLTPGGPAARARIAVGDVVLAVDGREAPSLVLPDVRSLLADPSARSVTLTVDHHGQTRTIVLELADLV